jgi:hypothetical protein
VFAPGKFEVRFFGICPTPFLHGGFVRFRARPEPCARAADRVSA